MSAPQPSEPRTAAGRAEHDIEHDLFGTRHTEPCNIVRRILAIEAGAAAPDPVASPAEAVRLLRELVACLSTATPVRGDLAQILAEARRFLEGAVASPLDVERLARALIGSDLMPRYHEYAMRVPTMNPSETVEHLAAVWAGWVAAAYEAEGQPVAEGRRHDPSDHDCRGGVRGDLFPQGQPAAEEPA